MKWLLIKRILIAFVLVTSVFGLSYFNYLSANNGYEGLTRLANNRKQKTDYKNLFDNTLYKSITIVFEEEVFSDLITSMETYFAQYGTYQDNTLHKVDIIYQDGQGNTFTVHEVGFRTKSNTSRNLPRVLDWRGREVYYQTSFQLQFNETFDYDQRSNEYGVLKSREVFNLDQLNFEYSKQIDAQPDVAMISEAFSYHLYQKAGVVVSNVSYGIVYLKIGDTLVNYGFYNFIEPIDNNFLSKHFDANVIGDYGDLFKCTDIIGPADLSIHHEGLIGININATNERYSYTLKNHRQNGLRTDFSILTNFIDNINDTDYFLRNANRIIDIDAFIRAIAMGFLIGNTDDYRHNFNNYYLYFEVYTKRAYYIPFDLDNVLGFGKHQDVSGDFGVQYPLIGINEMAVLVNQIFQSDLYREQYLNYLDDFVQNIFDYEIFLSEYMMAKNLYQSVLVNENHLGNQVFGLRNIEWYFTEKNASVTSQLEFYLQK